MKLFPMASCKTTSYHSYLFLELICQKPRKMLFGKAPRTKKEQFPKKWSYKSNDFSKLENTSWAKLVKTLKESVFDKTRYVFVYRWELVQKKMVLPLEAFKALEGCDKFWSDKKLENAIYY